MDLNENKTSNEGAVSPIPESQKTNETAVSVSPAPISPIATKRTGRPSPTLPTRTPARTKLTSTKNKNSASTSALSEKVKPVPAVRRPSSVLPPPIQLVDVSFECGKIIEFDVNGKDGDVWEFNHTEKPKSVQKSALKGSYPENGESGEIVLVKPRKSVTFGPQHTRYYFSENVRQKRFYNQLVKPAGTNRGERSKRNANKLEQSIELPINGEQSPQPVANAEFDTINVAAFNLEEPDIQIADFVHSNSSTSANSSSEYVNSDIPVVNEHQELIGMEESEERIYPELVNCENNINQIIPKLTPTPDPLSGFLIEDFKNHNISTVGEFCSLPISAIKLFTIQFPRIQTTKRVLNEYHLAQMDTNNSCGTNEIVQEEEILEFPVNYAADVVAVEQTPEVPEAPEVPTKKRRRSLRLSTGVDTEQKHDNAIQKLPKVKKVVRKNLLPLRRSRRFSKENVPSAITNGPQVHDWRTEIVRAVKNWDKRCEGSMHSELPVKVLPKSIIKNLRDGDFKVQVILEQLPSNTLSNKSCDEAELPKRESEFQDNSMPDCQYPEQKETLGLLQKAEAIASEKNMSLSVDKDNKTVDNEFTEIKIDAFKVTDPIVAEVSGSINAESVPCGPALTPTTTSSSATPSTSVTFTNATTSSAERTNVSSFVGIDTQTATSTSLIRPGSSLHKATRMMNPTFKPILPANRHVPNILRKSSNGPKRAVISPGSTPVVTASSQYVDISNIKIRLSSCSPKASHAQLIPNSATSPNNKSSPQEIVKLLPDSGNDNINTLECLGDELKAGNENNDTSPADLQESNVVHADVQNISSGDLVESSENETKISEVQESQMVESAVCKETEFSTSVLHENTPADQGDDDERLVQLMKQAGFLRRLRNLALVNKIPLQLDELKDLNGNKQMVDSESQSEVVPTTTIDTANVSSQTVIKTTSDACSQSYLEKVTRSTQYVKVVNNMHSQTDVVAPVQQANFEQQTIATELSTMSVQTDSLSFIDRDVQTDEDSRVISQRNTLREIAMIGLSHLSADERRDLLREEEGEK